MSRPSYLDLREEEEERIEADVTAPPPSAGLDLSNVKPTPAPRPTPDLQAQAVAVGRARGFGPAPSAAPKPAAAAPRAKKGRAGAAPQGPAKRYIVSLDERPPAGIQGQIALSGEALPLYEFIHRAHFERRPRGELLAAMLALYIEKNGETPEDY